MQKIPSFASVPFNSALKARDKWQARCGGLSTEGFRGVDLRRSPWLQGDHGKSGTGVRPGTSTDPPSRVVGPSVRRRNRGDARAARSAGLRGQPGQRGRPGHEIPRCLPALQGRFGNGPVTGLTDNDRLPYRHHGERAFYAPTGQPHNGPSQPPTNWLPKSGSGWCGDRQHGAAAVSRCSPCRRVVIACGHREH